MGGQCGKAATQMLRRYGVRVPMHGMIRIATGAGTDPAPLPEAQLQVGWYGRSRRQTISLDLVS
jgi:hypothetical protein